ncbi:TetR/AcrR family transcriptional regulator [Dickeya parazeae]|uniref:TetR/AcrR family transcriptional regulator n=1 Tax=Dickeya parazeae TaxID=2893572 RepID=UPI001AECBD9D|nr:TetR/AcrR family transcriptional regulator [Dickeya parazeae]MBP2836690.1 TetR/AcrR family transcriptional regulator [Dickeya parazeae]
MKVTKAQVQANRAHIVETASMLFREKGYDGVGVADLMAAAGFTHGGFYKHFDSKADLMAEAAACGFSQSEMKMDGVEVIDFIKYYLSREHRDGRNKGCTMAALCSDAARQNETIKATFDKGIERQLALLGGGNTAGDNEDMRIKIINILAHCVGAVILSRSCPDDSPLADEILDVCCREILSRLVSKDS